MSKEVDWILDQHRKTNHFYDTYLPYEFHLRMVVKVGEDFDHLLPKELFTESYEVHRGIWEIEDTTLRVIAIACWGHDLIEDTRTSYNDVKELAGEDVANIIYACTNLRGKNRAERANDEYYAGVRSIKGADYVKLCDRIANVQYSKMTGSRMFEMYKKENEGFLNKIGNNYQKINDYLADLFK